jgi:hypothetical protein
MRRGLIQAIATLAVSATFAQPASAASTTCGTAGRPWVAIRGVVPELPAIAELLRVELESRGIDLDAGAEGCGNDPIATIVVTRSERGAQIVVEVRDQLTAKRVAREVDLAAVPADSRTLTLAVAAAELLRASWAELALANAPPPTVTVPSAIEEALTRELVRPSASSPTAGFGAAAAIEHWTGGSTLYGADLGVMAWLAPRLATVLRLGVRAGATASAPDGQVRASAWVAGADAALRVTPWQADGIDAVARVNLEEVSYFAVPNPTAHGSSESGLALVAGAGAQGWFALSASIRLAIEGLVMVPIRPVRAQDAGRDVTAVSGVGVAGGLGLGAVL